MTPEALTLFDDLAFAGSPRTSSSAEGTTRGSGVRPLAPAPGAASNVRPTDPDTSHAAAANSIGRERIKELVRLTLLAHSEGLTDHELLIATGLPERMRGSVVKRRQDCGAVDSGARRLSLAGRPMVVWTLGGEA